MKQNVKERRALTCEHCGESFETQQALEQHEAECQEEEESSGSTQE